MTVLKFDPFGELEVLSRHFDQAFNEAFPSSRKKDTGTGAQLTPRVDITEDENNLYIQAELPGIAKEDVKVTVSKQRELWIEGEKKRKGRDGVKTYRSERKYGKFARSFHLPSYVRTDGVSGKFEQGVLILNVPKVEAAKPREIAVEIT